HRPDPGEGIPGRKVGKFPGPARRAACGGSFVSMEKRGMVGLMGVIGLALIGTLALQAVWLRNNINLRQTLLAESVDRALLNASERLDRIERMTDLQRDTRGQHLLMRLDTLRRRAATMAAPGMLGGADLLDPTEQELLVADLVRSILATDLHKDIRERIDPMLLDSLLAEELGATGIAGGYHYGVFGADGQPVLGAGDRADSAAWAATPHRALLFRHRLTHPGAEIRVLLTARPGMIMRGVWPMVILAVLLMIIIGTAFLTTIRIIYRQKRLSDIRNDLVNNMTHELKTPISTIGLACEALADPSVPRTEEQVRNWTNMIRNENKRLGTLVENVLQSAVMDSGAMVLKRVDLDVHALVHDVVRGSRMQVTRRDGEITTDLRAEIHRMPVDRTHLTNLLYNLIDNAVKYTEAAPRIRIATRSDHEGLHLSVQDNGIGIPASEQKKIFERLYRIPTGNVHNAKGYGLGLSYVRNVVQGHGGTIRVESTPGRGSTFHIFLPFHHGTTDRDPPRGR
ncbi:MAG: HAMP domain-containing sensor histidine kinase, partial [Flavobacteriales bacterium]|nr:HAMP domain-containing sensor histidine kinase [Flavobacteriales bacterium]